MQTNELTYFCFLENRNFVGSSLMLLNMAVNMGWNFLNTTIETAKFVSNLLILRRSSIGMLIISAHFLLLPIKCMRLKKNNKKAN